MATGTLISVNVGLPREVEWRGRLVRTSIWKDPIEGRARVSRLNVAGDRQSDLSVHGGIDKAVYVYPSEHYSYWSSRLEDEDLPWGAFGENLTTEGMLEGDVRIGDHLRVGPVELVVTQPRTPCFKLGIRFDRADMAKRFLESGRTGFYLSVVSEGEVAAGDPIELVGRSADALSVAEIVELYTGDHPDPQRLRRASGLPALPEIWRAHFRSRLGDDPARGD